MDPDEKFDFFVSRRGSVAEIAQEVADVLENKGYRIIVQDYDIPMGASFVEAMHLAVQNARDLVILYTSDYESSPYTRKEFTSFEAERAQSVEPRRIVILRCEDTPLRGLLADNVFQDLVGISNPDERRKRIVAAIEGRSQSYKPPPRPFHGVPPRIASFTGREHELHRLDSVLMGERPAAVIQSSGRAAIQGLGGVGKTSRAIEYAHRFRELYAGVWWCPAETRAGLVDSLAELAATWGARTDQANPEASAKEGLRLLSSQDAARLLVYDNVTSPDEIADLLPSSGARVLITSRFADWKDWAEEVAIDVLPMDEAAAFLEDRADCQDRDGARTLAEALGCLPLALNHAASYCRRTRMTFAEYATKAAGLIAGVPRGSAYPRSVAATFALAIAQAAKDCPEAAEILAFLAHCAPERVPLDLIEGAIDAPANIDEALLALADVSLVKFEPFEDGPRAVTVHRLVSAVARSQAEASGTAQLTLDRLLSRLLDLYPEESWKAPELWLQCARLTPHGWHFCRHDSDDERVQQFQLRFTHYFHGSRSYLEARPPGSDSESLAQIDEIRSKIDSERTTIREMYDRPQYEEHGEEGLRAWAENLVQMGNNCMILGTDMLPGAYAFLEFGLEATQQTFGPDHLATGECLNGFAAALLTVGDIDAAQNHLERGLRNHQQAAGPGDPKTQRIASNLARVLLFRGQIADALHLAEAALASHTKTLGPFHIWTKHSAAIVAEGFATSGRHSDAAAIRGRHKVSQLSNNDASYGSLS